MRLTPNDNRPTGQRIAWREQYADCGYVDVMTGIVTAYTPEGYIVMRDDDNTMQHVKQQWVQSNETQSTGT